MLRRAVDAYTGPLADGAGYLWLAGYRDVARREYVDAVIALADILAGPARAVLAEGRRHHPDDQRLTARGKLQASPIHRTTSITRCGARPSTPMPTAGISSPGPLAQHHAGRNGHRVRVVDAVHGDRDDGVRRLHDGGGYPEVLAAEHQREHPYQEQHAREFFLRDADLYTFRAGSEPAAKRRLLQ